MRRHAILLACLLSAAAPAAAGAAPRDYRSTPRVWTELGGRTAPAQPGTPVAVRTRAAAAFDLDHIALRDALPDGGAFTIAIPAPDGSLERFRAKPSPVLSPALARRFPGIRTFTATGIDDPAATAALDLTPLGFHAAVRSDRGFHYVDPRYQGDRSVYVAYFRGDLIDRHGPLVEPEEAAEELAGETADAPRRAPGDAVVARTYRLALANDPSYAAVFGNDAQVQAAKTTLISRVNQLYSADLAITMQLVGDPAALNFATGPEFDSQYSSVGAGCDSAFITRNDVVLDSLVGSTNYDIGHFVGGSAFNGGGIAGLGVVGGSA